jgi:hypothetical protein
LILIPYKKFFRAQSSRFAATPVLRAEVDVHIRDMPRVAGEDVVETVIEDELVE